MRMRWPNYPINRKFFTILLVLGLVVCFSFSSRSQNFGGNSWNQRWRQINTDTVRVIFPIGNEPQAQKVANTVHYLAKYHDKSIGDFQKKIDIVLQNQTVVSNGYVGLAPFRSELFLLAPQDPHQIGTNWLDLLTIHEYRHVQQFSNSRRGLTKFAYYLTGQAGWSVMLRLSIPDWFSEGDAVVSETALTGQGRGRLPSFYNDYRSLWIDSISYKYQKARNGSIKDFVPNEYNLGFLLTNYGRVTYGNTFWRDVIADAGKYKGLFYPFSNAIKRRTGYSTKGLYSQSQIYYQTHSNINLSNYSPDNQININDKKDTFTSYEFPVITANGKILALVHSYKRIPGIYEIDSAGGETKLVNMGRAIDYYYTHRNGKLLWAEFGNDERWSWNTYSNIVIYDIAQRKRIRLTHNSRFLSPDLSYDGKSIIAYEYKPDNSGTLVTISSVTGEVQNSLSNSDGYYFSYPRWAEDNTHAYVIGRNANGLSSIFHVNMQTDAIEALIPFTNHQLGIPVQSGNFIYFSASFSGVDNIYALNKNTHVITQITDGDLGSYQPSIESQTKTLYFSRFSSLGNNIYKLPFENISETEISIQEPAAMEDYAFLEMEKEGSDITYMVPDKHYNSKKYSQSSRLLNFHSWSWFFADPNFEWALRSNNVLNTLAVVVGLRYNSNEKGLGYFADVSYAQLYPVMNFSYGIQRRSLDFNNYNPVDPNDPVLNTERIYFWEQNVKTGIILPFDLSAGLYKTELNLISNYSFFSNKSENHDIDLSINALENGITILHRRIKAKQNIFSKNSQYLYLMYKNDIGTSLDSAYSRQFHFNSELTFGGLAPNHNILFQVAYKYEDNRIYGFSDNFTYSRGYDPVYAENITKFSANYHMPLAYPDWGFWGIIYLYRLRSNVFFDYSITNNRSVSECYNSTGLEFILDTRLLNYYDFSIGFRYAYLLNRNPTHDEKKQNVFEFFVPLMRF